MSDKIEQTRFCVRCGRELPPNASLDVCTRCALIEAASAKEPKSEGAPLFLDDLTRSGAEHDQPEAPCQMIGRYKLLEKVGEGGCGVVYVAEQQEPIHRRVAIKVIKLGMDTRTVVARFEAERQALAMMDHPNIAKVLDAGATDVGRPYFAMELVRGIKITDYCDQANLSTKERLGLFIRVCQAIQHAHQKGIIHRDIKPSNILVTLHDGVPVPKVIDFGIAKATECRLTDKTVYTQLHHFVGTPAYMSPEQAEMSGLDIDTRSDIYSLGVLLYELLTGRPPFDPEELLAAGLDAMRKTIREKEPLRPSTRLATMAGQELTTAAKRRSVEPPKLVHQVKGDLDWIVMKCLEKDRTRRYETTNGLAADLQRHLSNEPVTARPPNAGYRFRKMVRRNRTAFVATVVVALALVIGFSAAMVGFVQAVRAKAKEVDLRKQAQTLELASRRRAYVAEMNAAFHSFADNNLDHVHQILDRQRPKPGEEDLRGFEWRLLWQKARGNELMAFPGEGNGPVTYSPNGEFLAYSDERTTIRDAKTKKLIVRLPAHTENPSFSPDNRLLATSDQTNAMIWEVGTWQQVRMLPGSSGPVKFSPDGHWLLTADAEGYRLWNTAIWKLIGRAPGRSIGEIVTFSPDGKCLVTSSAGNYFAADHLRVWRIPAIQELAPIETGDPVATGSPEAVIFSRDGERILVGKEHGTILVFDFKTRKLLKTWHAHKFGVKCFGITPDGKRLLTGSNDHTVRLWDLATFEQLAQLGTHVGEVSGLAVSPDGREVVASSGHPVETTVWKISSRGAEPRINGVDTLAGALDHGRLLVAASTNDAAIWDPTAGTMTHLPIYGILEITNTGRSNYKYLGALKPDGSLFAVGRTNGTVDFWNLASRTKLSPLQAHQDPIYALAFSQDGRTLVTGSKRGEIKLWDTNTRIELAHLELPDGGVQCFSFSPNGSLLACGAEIGLTVWDIATRKEIIPSDRSGPWIVEVKFSPDGNLLAVAPCVTEEVHLWDIKSRTRVAILKGLRGGVYRVVFSPDGRTLAANGLEVKLWNIPSFLEIGTIRDADNDLWSIDFTSKGLGLAVAHGKRGKFVSLWPALSLEEIDRIDIQKQK